VRLVERAWPGLGAPSAPSLGPHACAGRPTQHHNAAYRRAYLAALARHQEIKRELVPLLAAWRVAGIETLLYKGFFLAEFVYPAPGTRYHGDVDALILPQHADDALNVALALGWRQRRYVRRIGVADGSALFDLYRPGGATQLDVHQLLVPAARWWKRRQRRITESVWAAAERREWEGVVVRTPAPRDAIVVNLALERATADRGHGFKSHDAADLAVLMERGALTREDLERRARDLGCARTLAHFLAHCRPAPGPTPTVRLSRLAQLRWAAVGAWEGGFVHVPTILLRAGRAPGLAWDIAWTLPLIARVRRALRRGAVPEVLASLTPAVAPATRNTPRRRWRTVRAIHWTFRLLPIGPAAGDCLPRALAMYAALRAQGWPVDFVSGVKRGPDGLVGHAWIEEDGGLLGELAGWERLPEYKANFRYPPRT